MFVRIKKTSIPFYPPLINLAHNDVCWRLHFYLILQLTIIPFVHTKGKSKITYIFDRRNLQNDTTLSEKALLDCV